MRRDRKGSTHETVSLTSLGNLFVRRHSPLSWNHSSLRYERSICKVRRDCAHLHLALRPQKKEQSSFCMLSGRAVRALDLMSRIMSISFAAHRRT